MGKTSKVEADFARLTVKVELSDSLSFSERDFELLVTEAVRAILGNCGPDFQISSFDSSTKKGSVIAAGADIQRVWAALSVYGSLFKRRLAVHFNALTEFEGVI